ncbi:MAG: BON domain-containing protein [Pirellulales bacterium]|nr:BON domain-containing protein [Pirellulales bacterium]
MIASVQRIRSHADDSQNVAKSVRSSLEQSAYHVLRTVSFSYEHGVLLLRGQLPTYFHKQLAQEAVRRINGVTRIVNQIEVTSEPSLNISFWLRPIENHINQPIKETVK